MKKILIINTVPFMANGISSVIMNYYTHLDREIFHCDFVAINNEVFNPYEIIMRERKAEVFFLERNGNIIAYVSDLKKIIKQNGYDIVHIHGNSCTMAVDLFAAWLGGCKRRIAHSHSVACKHMKTHKLLRPLFECLVTDRLACGDDAGKWMFGNRQFQVIENAMDIRKYQYSEDKRKKYRHELDIKNCEFLIGHVGTFTEPKNQKFIIDLLREINKENQNVKLLLVGEGEKIEDISEYVKANFLQDKVVFYGVSDDMAGLLSAMDVFVFPSKSEGLGMVMIEAQLAGLSCVASKNVPQSTDISGKCVYLDLNDEISIWKEAVLKADKTNRAIPKGERVENYDINKQVAYLKDLYLKMRRH